MMENHLDQGPLAALKDWTFVGGLDSLDAEVKGNLPYRKMNVLFITSTKSWDNGNHVHKGLLASKSFYF